MKLTSLDFSAAEKALGLELIANGKGSQALHDAVVAYQANRRAGTHSTKTKAEVNRSNRKPWRQKGTGNARAGFYSSPIWRGGGVVFGPKPRDYSKKLPKKVKQLALRKAVSESAKAGGLYQADSIESVAAKTKEFVSAAKQGGLGESVLILTNGVVDNLLLATRNLPRVHVMQASDANAEDILLYKELVIASEAMPVLGNRLK